ncbi:hypothetical protein Tco_0519546, partial [Tanacetum coccineum]
MIIILILFDSYPRLHGRNNITVTVSILHTRMSAEDLVPETYKMSQLFIDYAREWCKSE